MTFVGELWQRMQDGWNAAMLRDVEQHDSPHFNNAGRCMCICGRCWTGSFPFNKTPSASICICPTCTAPSHPTPTPEEKE